MSARKSTGKYVLNSNVYGFIRETQTGERKNIESERRTSSLYINTVNALLRMVWRTLNMRLLTMLLLAGWLMGLPNPVLRMNGTCVFNIYSHLYMHTHTDQWRLFKHILVG